MQTTIHKCGEKLLIEMPTGLSAKLDWGVGDVLSVEVVEGGLKVERVMTAHDHAFGDRAGMHGRISRDV